MTARIIFVKLRIIITDVLCLSLSTRPKKYLTSILPKIKIILKSQINWKLATTVLNKNLDSYSAPTQVLHSFVKNNLSASFPFQLKQGCQRCDSYFWVHKLCKQMPKAIIYQKLLKCFKAPFGFQKIILHDRTFYFLD